jgi:hypothetical protein
MIDDCLLGVYLLRLINIYNVYIELLPLQK